MCNFIVSVLFGCVCTFSVRATLSIFIKNGMLFLNCVIVCFLSVVFVVFFMCLIKGVCVLFFLMMLDILDVCVLY